MTQYILNVDAKGKNRLALMGGFLNPQSKDFLNRVGIKPGMKVLEVGCGTGEMTSWLAQQVGKNGLVVALDSSEEQLQHAKQRLVEEQLNQVEFVCHDVHSFDRGERYDLIYSRFVLIHMLKPQDTLKVFQGLLNRGGLVICEELVIDDVFTYPETDLWHRVVQAYKTLSEKNGVDPNYGKRLYSDMMDAGFQIDEKAFTQAIMSPKDLIEYLHAAYVELKDSFLSQDVMSKEEYDVMLSQLGFDSYEQIKYSSFHKVAHIIGTLK